MKLTKLSVFSTKPYDKKYLQAALDAREADTAATTPRYPIELTFHDFPLNATTAALLPEGQDAVCVFVNDALPAPVVHALADRGVSAILLRCAGSNHVDLEAARERGLMVANVPSYSPEAVAEFAVALLQTLNRGTHRAYNRVREGNFALEGLLGRTLHGKTVGVVGTGRIGLAAARILAGFGCRVLAYDLFPNEAALGEIKGAAYRDLDSLLVESDILTLHCPLTPQTKHMINDDTIARLQKKDVLLVNTSRGGLVDTDAVVRGLKSRRLGGVALDVYEGEGSLFYEDHSGDIIDDDVLMRLMTFPNVIVTGHQAFFTHEALHEIAECTLRNLDEFVRTGTAANSLTHEDRKTERKPHPVRNV
jgi:D-lactate dehydrogenase